MRLTPNEKAEIQAIIEFGGETHLIDTVLDSRVHRRLRIGGYITVHKPTGGWSKPFKRVRITPKAESAHSRFRKDWCSAVECDIGGME